MRCAHYRRRPLHRAIAGALAILPLSLVQARVRECIRYPSCKYEVEVLAVAVIPAAGKECGDETPINFVTHSLGGIVLRQYLHSKKIPQLKRVVMPGPPNRGSQVVAKFEVGIIAGS